MYRDELIKEAKEYVDIFADTFCHECVDELGNNKCCEEQNCMLQELVDGKVSLFGGSIFENEKYQLFICEEEYEKLTKKELRDTIILSKEFNFEIVFDEKEDTYRLIKFLECLELQLNRKEK